MCTWLRDDEFKKFETVGDEYINGLLQEVRSLADNRYLLQEKEGFRKTWLGKPKPYALYTLYIWLQGSEVHVVNFCQDHEWSINSTVTKSYMVTFLLGILAGVDIQKTNGDKN